jgi:UDP-N-acetylglucosamine--N-acetylmuramyl-(pentapeptide) pyrophosphoryl-undecaprenol N-acetylglucosamine transferase
MTIVLTGGGSGGHITPILAIADELKHQDPTLSLVYIGQTGDGLSDLPVAHSSIDTVYSVRAGKFRRYHGEGLKQLLDLATLFKNVRDAVYVLIGLYQSWRLLRRLRPSLVFIKGGFVGVPVGFAAAKLGIPYITHDSDAIPGLANRLIAPWAKYHAVALPKELYRYDAQRTVTTGIPLQKNFKVVTKLLQAEYRKQLHVPVTAKVLFILGGGLGSQRVCHIYCGSIKTYMFFMG